MKIMRDKLLFYLITVLLISTIGGMIFWGGNMPIGYIVGMGFGITILYFIKKGNYGQ